MPLFAILTSIFESILAQLIINKVGYVSWSFSKSMLSIFNFNVTQAYVHFGLQIFKTLHNFIKLFITTIVNALKNLYLTPF